jgi:apolipoprotein N-acyltransferase
MQMLLPVLTGLLLVAAFPRIDQGYLAWVAFVPLIVFVAKTNSCARAFWGGFLAGVVELFGLLIWIPPVLAQYGGLTPALSWIAYGLMVLMLACYPGIACALTRLLINSAGDWSLLAFPAIWVAVEYALNFTPFGGFPWLPAGYSQTNYLRLIQIADVAGVYGVSFLILCFGTALSWALLFSRRRFSWLPPVAAGALVLAAMAYGIFEYGRWHNFVPSFRVAMLQGNFSPDDGLLPGEPYRMDYAKLAESLKVPDPDLLVLPESPSFSMYPQDEAYRQELDQLAGRTTLGLVFNNVRSRDENRVQYFNSAYFLGRDGRILDVYDKIHLVPFGEYIPLKKIFSFTTTISKDVGEFSPGVDFRVVPLQGHPVNALICFEAVFPNLVRQFVRRGSQLILNLTNDGWYGNSAAPYQHLAIARWRAIETRRYLLRAANTGISAVIEPAGVIQTATELQQKAVCAGRFGFIAHQTVYSRYGDVLVFLCAIIPCGLMVFVQIRKLVPVSGKPRRTF